jgi:predicted transcriptional regulator
MYYTRTSQIERRFAEALEIIKTSTVNTNTLAAKLKISRPTAMRIVGELRRRGYLIRSVHDGIGWRYEFIDAENQEFLPVINRKGACIQYSQIQQELEAMKDRINGTINKKA